jgi:hypothetical protein
MAKPAKNLAAVQEHLEPGEQILQTVPGAYETKLMDKEWTRNGLLLATDRRLIFYAKKLGGYDMESFPYRSISSVEAGKSLTGHKVTFFASGNRVSLKYIHLEASALTEFLGLIRGQATQGVSSSAASAPDVADQIRRLGALRDEGLLSEEEFQRKKEQILGLE